MITHCLVCWRQWSADKDMGPTGGNKILFLQQNFTRRMHTEMHFTSKSFSSPDMGNILRVLFPPF